MKLLLVEDEQKLSSILAKGLKKLAYAVDVAFDGEEALLALEQNRYDLVVLDLNLPRVDGLSVLQMLRQTDRETKVLILSAQNRVEDKIRGLDLGANDFLEKPFDFGELAARIRNLLRWSFVRQDACIHVGELCIDTVKQSVRMGDQMLELRPKEYAILDYLARQGGRYVSAEELIEHVWDSEVDLFSNALKFHIYALKKKLAQPELIGNLRGKGYCLHVDKENSEA